MRQSDVTKRNITSACNLARKVCWHQVIVSVPLPTYQPWDSAIHSLDSYLLFIISLAMAQCNAMHPGLKRQTNRKKCARPSVKFFLNRFRNIPEIWSMAHSREDILPKYDISLYWNLTWMKEIFQSKSRIPINFQGCHVLIFISFVLSLFSMLRVWVGVGSLCVVLCWSFEFSLVWFSIRGRCR